MFQLGQLLSFSAAFALDAWRATLLLWIMLLLGSTAVFARLFRAPRTLTVVAGAVAAAVLTYGCIVALVLSGGVHT